MSRDGARPGRPRRPAAVLVVTGDELLRGFVQEANSSLVAHSLRRLGIALREVRICGDDLESIEAAIRRTAAEHDASLVVVTGGLGPTHDDRTSEAVASVTGRELELRDDALALVERQVASIARSRGIDPAGFDEGNRKQASVPAGAVLLDPLGTAPGYLLTDDHGTVFVVLPGPPAELRHAWQQAERSAQLAAVVPERATHERVLRTWGVPESHAARALADLGHHDTDACRVTLCARGGELEICVRGSDAGTVDRMTDSLADGFGSALFSLDDERPVAALVGGWLARLGLTVALAESCTGGMVGSLLTDIAGSSAYVRGGVIAYANEVKQDLLNVPAGVLDRCGAVSREVAEAMATGARARCGADVGLSTTGIAGPDGGSEEKPVGTVWIGVDVQGDVQATLLGLHGDRQMIRSRAAIAALHLLRTRLAGRA